MKKWHIWVMVCIVSALLCLAASGAAYSGGKMIDLGPPPWGVQSAAFGINNSGQIVGFSWINGDDTRAFLYYGGKWTDLGTLGGTASEAYGINDSGQIVGWSYTASWEVHAFLYSDGKMTDLGTLWEGGWHSKATGINNNGQIVGSSLTASGFHVFLSSGGTMMDLGSQPGYKHSFAQGINDSGQIVGYSMNSADLTDQRAFLYYGGNWTDLGTLGGDRSEADGINNKGQIVGWSTIALHGLNEAHAFLYSDGQMTDLGTLPGEGYKSAATRINGSGQIVGEATTSLGETRAFLYSGGKMTNLGTLGAGMSRAHGINDRGQTVGYSTVYGDGSEPAHAFLYNPASHSLPAILPLLLGD